ncbi:hypothetical protein GWK47_049324 [Chionoecetes opilio]|uniref:Uncharacterized protein n=1 Tax=Chionoecetes opilio TaxID=41210 RepID=A0A8J5CU99_CHIOP|nr:hypothetical protein GWK47_049324 [Chionoecetes opilio]
MPVEEEEEQGPRGGGLGPPANLHAQLEEWLLLWLSCPSTTDVCTHPEPDRHPDVQSVAEWNQGLRAPFTKAAAKAQGTWNLQNRSSVVAKIHQGEDWEEAEDLLRH